MLSFEPLRKVIAYRNIKITDIVNEEGMSSTTTAKINKDKPIAFETINRFCAMLGVPVSDVLLFVDAKGNPVTNGDNNIEQLKQEIMELRQRVAGLEKANKDLEQYKAARTESNGKNGIPGTTNRPNRFIVLELRTIRRKSKLTQAELSEAIGITGSYLGMFERQEKYMNDEHLAALKRKLPIPEENIIEIV